MPIMVGLKRRFARGEETCYRRHSQYYGIEMARLAEMMRTPVPVDGRNVFDKDKARQTGFLQGRRELLGAMRCIEASQWQWLCQPTTRKS
jgi:hypothetical protein